MLIADVVISNLFSDIDRQICKPILQVQHLDKNRQVST